jgi:hypothetical protein
MTRSTRSSSSASPGCARGLARRHGETERSSPDASLGHGCRARSGSEPASAVRAGAVLDRLGERHPPKRLARRRARSIVRLATLRASASEIVARSIRSTSRVSSESPLAQMKAARDLVL